MTGNVLSGSPPINFIIGVDSNLPFRSHNAISIALNANDAIPSGPYHHILFCKSLCISILSNGSRPSKRSSTPLIICSVALHASGKPVPLIGIASPQPTTPSLVSILQKVKNLVWLSSFDSGYATLNASTLFIDMKNTPYRQFFHEIFTLFYILH